MLAAVTVFDKSDEALLEVGQRDAVDDVSHKSNRHHRDGFLVRDASLTEVKEPVFVELSRRQSVRTLDIVGVDLELGLGVHLGIPAQKEVSVILVRLCLLGIFGDVDHPGE